MDIVLQMFKIDLGINHDKRDEFFLNYLFAQKSAMEEKGVAIDLQITEDQMLLSDYAAWNYRKRTEDIGLSKNLQERIRNKQVRGRAQGV